MQSACRPRKGDLRSSERASRKKFYRCVQVSQHLSAKAVATTELEALGIRLKEAEADAAGTREAMAELRAAHAAELTDCRTDA